MSIEINVISEHSNMQSLRANFKMTLNFFSFEFFGHLSLFFLEIGSMFELKSLIDDIILGKEHKSEGLDLMGE